MDIVERLKQGIDPQDIPEAERAMDFGADEIERISSEANKARERFMAEIERLRKAMAMGF